MSSTIANYNPIVDVLLIENDHRVTGPLNNFMRLLFTNDEQMTIKCHLQIYGSYRFKNKIVIKVVRET